MDAELMTYDVTPPVARITLNRPSKLNALSNELVRQVRDAVARAASDDTVKVLVLQGAGRAFSAGHDLEEEVADELESADQWHHLLSNDIAMTSSLLRIPKPTIAAVHGYCLAAGCELAMCCDMIIATEDARFGEPEIRYGSGPVTMIMPFVIGEKKTNELLFTGDVIDAHEAERLGIVNRVVAADRLQEEVNELAARIALTPAAVLRYTKLALIRARDAMGLGAAIAANQDLSAILNACDTPEQREFDVIVARDGLKAALAWRDTRYGATA